MRRRTTRDRRARAGLAWALGLFVVGQGVLGLYLDYARPLTRFPSAGQVVDHAVREPEAPRVVFVGSSRTGGAVLTDEMNSILADSSDLRSMRALNAATPGGESISAEFVLKQLEENRVRARVLVIEVWPEAFNRKSPFMVQHAIRQFNWGDVPEYGDDMLRAKVGWLFLQARLVPAYTHRKQIVKELKQSVQHTERAQNAPATTSGGPLDWTTIIRTASPAEQGASDASAHAARTTIRKWLTPYQMDGPAIDALERIVQHARADGTEVYLVSMPTCSAHRAEYVPEVERPFNDLIDRFVRDYGCRYVDAKDWVPDSLYQDLLHVTLDGGRLFTRRFAREVLAANR